MSDVHLYLVKVSNAMSYFITCTFDLKDGTPEDYQDAYADLDLIGLYREIVDKRGQRRILPTTTVAGLFYGSDSVSVRNDVNSGIRSAFASRGFTYELFLSVGTGWAWVHHQ